MNVKLYKQVKPAFQCKLISRCDEIVKMFQVVAKFSQRAKVVQCLYKHSLCRRYIGVKVESNIFSLLYHSTKFDISYSLITILLIFLS